MSSRTFKVKKAKAKARRPRPREERRREERTAAAPGEEILFGTELEEL